ncbi:MAG TPA: 4-hydroxythreonine-4-phosphate dehydrogenase PdxA [Cyclobacteriaceae bacterium]|nr:4-hydroxythreonine-4-phosphate dehydrogenase PdxA [Cyclobacteriaceae bacterium]HRJ82755.1 4-hydroxythreonine-4-phosphate dehydrogenase PdxA [Cyclobacteriaceae bacterium]
MSTQQKPRIGITLGDLNGIGPEVVIKALQDNRLTNLITPVIYGSTRVLSFYKKQLNIEEFNYGHIKSRGQYIPKTINVVNCWEDVIEITPGKPAKESGKAAWLALQQATQDLKEGLIDAMVTAPIDKNTIHSDEFPYRGHTEYLANFFETKDFVMLMVSESLRVGLVTEHVPVKDITTYITRELVESKLRILEQCMRKDFGINKPKIAVLGLNPHAGDGGLIGSEDDTILKPVIQDWKSKGKIIAGPFPADGFFASGNYSKYDGVLAMYHDQGLIPFKLLSFESGVNYTAGLPVVRTSPDHGTAYSIAGKNLANEGSFRQALYTAVDIATSRSQPSKD